QPLPRRRRARRGRARRRAHRRPDGARPLRTARARGSRAGDGARPGAGGGLRPPLRAGRVGGGPLPVARRTRPAARRPLPRSAGRDRGLAQRDGRARPVAPRPRRPAQRRGLRRCAGVRGRADRRGLRDRGSRARPAHGDLFRAVRARRERPPGRPPAGGRALAPGRAASPCGRRGLICYRSKTMLAGVEVVVPASPEEAVGAFGDGCDVTVIAGGTIVMPDVTARRLRPARALLLTRAGLDGIERADGKVTIGAATPLAALEDGDEPLASAARHVGDPEIRGQATVGGNLCSTSSEDAPRGDLQAPLIVLGATVRSAGSGGERAEPVEDFLADGAGRDGEVRLAATGIGPRAVRLDPNDPLAGIEPPDDAVASGWYRAQFLPKL